MQAKRVVSLGVGVGLLWCWCAEVDVHACALLGSPDAREMFIVSEDAIIVWNADDKIQHFIRRADFATDRADLGFIVPTPSQPELHEADSRPFAKLNALIYPHVQRTEYDITWTFTRWVFEQLESTLKVSSANDSPIPSMPVRVLKTTRVSGYEAVILEANDTPALLDWLKRHGYEAHPGFQEWLEPYVAQGWKITAFKYAKTEVGERITTKPVRMSFATDTPFFPYREPTLSTTNARRHPQRHLHIYFIAAGRVEARLGKDRGTPWEAGRLKGAIQLRGVRKLLKDSIPASQIPRDMWLTAFLDTSVNRFADDLYFTPSANQAVIKPTPIIDHVTRKLLIPLDVISGLVVLVAMCWGVIILWKQWYRPKPVSREYKANVVNARAEDDQQCESGWR